MVIGFNLKTSALDHPEISGDSVSELDLDEVAHNQILGHNLVLLTLSDNFCGLKQNIQNHIQ